MAVWWWYGGGMVKVWWWYGGGMVVRVFVLFISSFQIDQ